MTEEKIVDKVLAKNDKKFAKKYLDDLKATNKVFEDDLVNNTSKKLNKYRFARVGTALLYEKVGDSEVFDMAYPVLANEDKELGNYIVMQLGVNKFIFLDNITPDDWSPTRNNTVKKLVEVVKFADDDYRVRGKVKNKTFYTKKPVYKTETRTEEVETENGIETFTEQVPVIDEASGEPVIDFYEEDKWVEPKAVTQSGREAIRIGNAYKIRMQKKRAEKEGLWSKYGMQIMLVFMVIMLCGTWYMTTKMQVAAINSEWSELREERGKGVLDPEVFAKKVVEEQMSIEAHEDAPPR